MHLDAAALRARVREAGAGTLELKGKYSSDDVSFAASELAGALAAEGAGLTGLELPRQELGTDGWRAVFEALRKGACPRLAALMLEGCGLGDAGFGALAEALGRGACPGMATLDAARNGLTVLPEALCGVASLEELILSANNIGSLPHGLLHLARLRRLGIERNPRLAAEAEIVGDTHYSTKDNDLGALFAHLRSVHGGEPPPLEGQAPVYAEMRRGDDEAEAHDAR